VVLLQSAQSGACFLARRQVIGLLSSNEQVEALALIVMPVLVVTFIGECGFLQYPIGLTLGCVCMP
jgi:nitrate reductase NapE component